MEWPMREVSCQRCGAVFVAKRNDAKFCPTCKSKGVHEGNSNVCPECGGYKYGTTGQCQSCENKAKAKLHSGANNENWKGGITKTHGYVLIRQGAGRNAHYKQEHRIVWEAKYGAIPEGYVIHHLNGIKDDNHLANLACLPIAAHSGPAIHRAYKTRIRQLEARIRELEKGIQPLLKKC